LPGPMNASTAMMSTTNASANTRFRGLSGI
jgi:hypothetical protein